MLIRPAALTEIIDFKTDYDETKNLIDSDEADIVDAKKKFEQMIYQLPKKDASPIYMQINGFFL